jgi:hypothetical protein
VYPARQAVQRGVLGQEVDLVGRDHYRVRACDLPEVFGGLLGGFNRYFSIK